MHSVMLLCLNWVTELTGLELRAVFAEHLNILPSGLTDSHTC